MNDYITIALAGMCCIGAAITYLLGPFIGPRGGIHDPIIDNDNEILYAIIGRIILWGSVALGVWFYNRGWWTL